MSEMADVLTLNDVGNGDSERSMFVMMVGFGS